MSHVNTYMRMYQIGYTPLMIAVRNGRLPMIEYLLERGADTNTQNNVNDSSILVFSPYRYDTPVHRTDRVHCIVFPVLILTR